MWVNLAVAAAAVVVKRSSWMSRTLRSGWAVTLFSLWPFDDASAQCRTSTVVVDTGEQACGLAPRFDVALELHVGGAFGKPCLGAFDDRSCIDEVVPFEDVEGTSETQVAPVIGLGFGGATAGLMYGTGL